MIENMDPALFISTVGFPIAATVILWRSFEKTLAANTLAVVELRSAVQDLGRLLRRRRRSD